jgi:hypothetical protein
MNRKLTLQFLFILIFGYTSAQVNNCEQSLTQADAEFNAGHFFGIPSILSSCLQSGFSNEQKVRAYLLLTQTYLILDDPISAEDSYLKLLKADPEYVANPARDPIDVYYLSKKFTSTPVLTPHFRLGFNFSRPHTIYELNTSGYDLDKKNVFKIGFQFGAGLDWNINNNWSFCGEFNYANKSFKKITNGYSINDSQEFTERHNGFDIPIYIKYSYDSGKIRPFAYAGFAFNILASSKASLIFDDNTPSNPSVGIKENSGATETLTSKRKLFNHSLVVGAGIKYKIGKDFLYGDVRYMLGLSNMTIPDKNYYTSDGSFDPSVPFYQFVSDFFRLDNLAFSVGYIHPIYNPRKKSKGLFGDFKKKNLNLSE